MDRDRTSPDLGFSGEAIATALKEASAVDLVLIAGKGHEDYQIYGTTRRAFSDEQVARAVLEALP